MWVDVGRSVDWSAGGTSALLGEDDGDSGWLGGRGPVL